MTNTETIIEIDPRECTFIVRRERDAAGFEELKDSIRQIGQRTVLQVQDISGWKAEKRCRPDGGLYHWRAAFGQGRCTAAIELFEETGDKKWLRIPAKVVTSAESELAGASMTENMLRKSYSWLEQARLMKADIENFPLETVARGYSVSIAHLKRVLKVMNKLNPRIEKELKSISLSDAEALASIPQDNQQIVLDVMKDEGLRASQLPAIVRKARELPEGSPELSKTALKASLRRVGEDLARAREAVKPIRLHYSIGSENLWDLLTNKKYARVRAAIDAEGIDTARFLELAKEFEE